MIYKIILLPLVALWICSIFHHVNAELDQDGNNICFKQVKRNQTIQVKYSYPVEVTTFMLCAKFPFSCKVKKTEYRVAVRPENRTVYKKEYHCCEGYYTQGAKCKPFCPTACVNGECSAPNVCDCHLGSGGVSCNITCPPMKFGINCEYDCACLLKPHCNKNYVDCSCDPGQIKSECHNICKCKLPTCLPGLTGESCNVTCPKGTFGSNCIEKCLCQERNTDNCNKETGDCFCRPSYYGIFCEHKCKDKLVCDTPTNCKCVFESKVMPLPALPPKPTPVPGPPSNPRDNNHGLIFGLIALLIVKMSVSMILVYKYKLKTKKLKRDIQNIQVRYSSGGSRDQFDNPVYSSPQASANLQMSNYNSSSHNDSAMYAPSSIQTTTLSHLPKINNPNNGQLSSSLTVPPKPKQNEYFNELSLLPATEFLMQKNALADATNLNSILTQKKNSEQFSPDMNNIYTTIDEVRSVDKSYKNEIENDFKDDFNDHFNAGELVKASTINNDQPF